MNFVDKYLVKMFFIFFILVFLFLINFFITRFNNQNKTEINKFKLEDNLLQPNLSYFSNFSNSSNLIKNDYFSEISSVLYADGFFDVQSGPMRLSTEEEKIINDTISVYEVKNDDTLNSIAQIFNVSKNTIIYANDLKGKKIKTGDILYIFPITGTLYTVKNSGTIEDIAKKYKLDAKDIAEYNNLSITEKLAKNDTVFIPNIDGDTLDNLSGTKKPPVKSRPRYSYPILSGYFMKPVSGCRKTQGIHGYNAVDIGCPVGTVVVAAAAGKVIRAATTGYNGGYGKVVFITHKNGTQTIYAHLDGVNVSLGQNVEQGQIIGRTGNSGRSTGPHLHLEIRGAANPF